MDCSTPRLLCPWGFSGKKTGVGGCFLLQEIFPIQGLNPGLPHCRQILYHLKPPGKPKNTGVGRLSLLQGIFLTQESNWGLLHCRRILYQLSYQGSPCPLKEVVYLKKKKIVVNVHNRKPTF